MTLEFHYFRGPESDMVGLLPGIRTCSFCGQPGRCFSLDNLVGLEHTEKEQQGKVGCLDCLRRDCFGFAHDTEVGFITEEGLEPYDGYNDKARRLFLVGSDGEATLSGTPLAPLRTPKVSEEAVVELRRTPKFSTWQDFLWPGHHNDFMAYLEHTESPSAIVFGCLHCDERTEIDDPD